MSILGLSFMRLPQRAELSPLPRRGEHGVSELTSSSSQHSVLFTPPTYVLTCQDAELSGTLSLVLTQCCKRIKDTVQKLASDHKDIHSSVSRVGKAIDKNFDSDISSVGIDGCWQADSQRLLNEVMVEHFFRQGMLDVAEELCQESGLSVDPSQKEPFVELNRILEALKVRVLRPALEWAVSNREMLIAQNSSLEFKLHRLYFISLFMGGTTNQREALQYAKNFQPFALNHQKDIQVLMGSLVYLRQGIENSPYVHLLDANQWADICDIFTRDACALLGLSVESPLSVSFSAGCVALPALINIKAVIEQRQCTGVWNQKDELPIEVDLGKKCWYHSIFACPILRQQTTDNNPPMKLSQTMSSPNLRHPTRAGKFLVLGTGMYRQWALVCVVAALAWWVSLQEQQDACGSSRCG
ncbi:Protein RMD5-like protein A [Microtus ochrogaster]|uniref:Protein RMD5-like protein A n=1 Tax=Microtus ochrogaster TaxID=79684 RepID=A0A8J6GYQ7_MICOH|nr:Protein RMD5-like protein A [Microtus ochrogaster]